MIFYLTFIIVGAVLFAFALTDFRRCVKFVRKGKWVEGTVIKMVETKGEDNDLYYHPVFEVYINEQETITYQGVSGTSHPSWRIGQKAAFIYAPGESPALKRLRYWSVFWRPILLLAVSIDLILVGAGYFLLQPYFGG